MALFLGKFFFGSWKNYWSTLKTALTPDWMSWVNGNLWNDNIAELQVWLHLVVCGAVFAGEYYLLMEIFG